MDINLLNKLHELMFEEPCPKCGVMIQKSGGCNHMSCGKCNYEFCWWCLTSYYHYRHGPQSYCPFRYIAIIWNILFLVFMLNLKTVWSFDSIKYIQVVVFYNVGSFLFAKIYLFSFAFYLFWIDKVQKRCKPYLYYYNDYNNRCLNTF